MSAETRAEVFVRRIEAATGTKATRNGSSATIPCPVVCGSEGVLRITTQPDGGPGLKCSTCKLRHGQVTAAVEAAEAAGNRRPANSGSRPASLGAALDEVLTGLRLYLDLAPGEETFVIGALAGGVAKDLVGEEPLWLMLVGASGGGKTEAIRLLDRVVDRRVDELTRAGLLSWAPGKKAKRVGLLTRIPAVALVTISDFSTVVTMGDREARARMFGMLRVVYDGSIYRGIGGEPGAEGDELEWKGHLTLIAGATPAVDTHSSFEGALGERWLTLRLPESDAARARQRARFVCDRRDVDTLRRSAQEKARELVLAARQRVPEGLAAEHVDKLVDVAAFVAHARTGIVHEGQGRGRVITGIPTPEEPTRIIGQLQRFARCVLALGVGPEAAVALATRAALDSVPPARIRVLRAIAESGDKGITVSDAHRALGRGSRWTAIWELDALDAIGMIRVEGASREEDPAATRFYYLAQEWRGVYTSEAFSHDSLLI